MSGFIRRAGCATLADGAQLVWSVADGRHGRRWRAVASIDGAISHAMLLEVDLDGRLSRLELTTPAGMLTLHPEPADRALHGNVVTPEGVRHLQLPWSDEHGLEIAGRPIASAVTAHRLRGSVAILEATMVPVVVVTADLRVEPATRRFSRLGESEWRIEETRLPGSSSSASAPASAAHLLTVDARGTPIGLVDGQEWPLELESAT